MLRPLRIPNKLDSKPKSTNHIALAASVFTIDGGTRKIFVCPIMQETWLMVRNTDCFHGKLCRITK
jgi:hypothetical protein